jgi:hypothetical protein
VTPTSVFDAAPGSLKVYQIETTNWCNATCTYCPQPTHKREKGFLSEAVLSQTLDVMSNKIVSLHHFGEPLLNKKLDELVEMAASRGFQVGFSTNGKVLTQDRLDRLRALGLSWMRLHTDPFGVRLKDFAVPEGLEFTEHRLLVKSDAPKKEMVSFSGHLDLKEVGGAARCSYLKDNWVVVLWNGDLALCCHDVEGTCSTDLCTNCNGYVFKSPRDHLNYDGDS